MASMTRPAVGFIGLGAMGKPMAARLLAEGFPVTSCAHKRREALDELERVRNDRTQFDGSNRPPG